jgi:anaerobic selenocysteine-containing dehydrogenase
VSQDKVVKTICNLCPLSCGLDVQVREGKIIGIAGMKEHPLRRICIKARGLIDWVYASERVTSPMRRTNGKWQEISWDEALGIIADKLSQIKERYGARAFVVHLGYPFIASHISRLASRFCSIYGSPNFTTGGSLCFMARAIGHGLTCNHAGLPLLPNFRSTRCMIIWGSNPPQSNIMMAAAITSARKQGARLIVIDPRRTPLARRADIYAQIRPGTDCALALGLLNVIIAEELYDKPFVQEWTVGFEQLLEHVRDYPPQRVADITWVPKETIEDIARSYAQNRPATIAQGVSLDHCSNGVQTSRAIATLIAITGNIDIPGGNVYNLPLKQSSLRVRGRVSVEDAIGAGYPLFTKLTRETTAMPVPDAIISGKPYPIRALIVQGSNPILTWPNSNKVKEAFSKLELLVVIDPLMTETAKLAHIFLPAATFLESKVLKDYGVPALPVILSGEQAIAPLGDSLPDWRIWSELGRKMGYGEYFPWQDEDELFEYLLQPTGITLDQLKERPGGVFYRPRQRQKHLREGFNTPSGKVEIYSQTMAEHGYPPLPTFEEPAPSPLRQPDWAEKYPLILITGVRVNAFTHSQHRNVAMLRRRCPEPFVEINAETAKKLEILNGDMILLETVRGSIKLKASISEDIHPRVLSIQHGWSEANANILTDDRRDPVSGYPALRSIPCRVIKVGKGRGEQ